MKQMQAFINRVGALFEQYQRMSEGSRSAIHMSIAFLLLLIFLVSGAVYLGESWDTIVLVIVFIALFALYTLSPAIVYWRRKRTSNEGSARYRMWNYVRSRLWIVAVVYIFVFLVLYILAATGIPQLYWVVYYMGVIGVGAVVLAGIVHLIRRYFWKK